MRNTEFDLTYERILRAANVYQDVDLAGFLGITPQAVGAAKKKMRVPRTWFAHIQAKTGITREELCRAPDPIESACVIDLPSAPGHEENTPIHKLLVMTSEILESNTVYRSALAANIRAFHKAVEGESEMSDLREKMDQLLRKMDGMEKQLSKLQGADEPEKKQAGNDH